MTLPTDGTRLDSYQPTTAFWNVNVPLEEHTKECPEFLRYALENEKDRAILSTPDALYRRQTWEDVQGFILANRLDLFQRVPSDLRLYREYCAKLVREYGSVMKFVVEERLLWEDLTCSGRPFSNPSMSSYRKGVVHVLMVAPDDFKILYNDWPYGIDERIVHLVIWTKFELPADPDSEIGDMAQETRKVIQEFVDGVFSDHCGKENVIWFKNWTSLKSIHAVEHFHVMLFDPDLHFVDSITNGDVPLMQKLRHGVKDS